jgi:hypothetical protein
LSNKNRQNGQTSNLDKARDELFAHINRCGVLKASEEQQVEWMTDTLGYIGECYPDLGDTELKQLKAIGLRFCRPAVPYGQRETDEPAAEPTPEAAAA